MQGELSFDFLMIIKHKMKTTNTGLLITLLTSIFLISACSSSSSSSGGSGEDARDCVKRSLNTVYTNTCEFDVNVLVLKKDEKVFKIDSDDASTRSASSTPFGACRAPSEPVPKSDFSSYTCS